MTDQGRTVVERGIPLTVITWGDSVANFIGINIKGIFNDVVNRGTNGAGLDNVQPPQPLPAARPVWPCPLQPS